MTNLWVYVAIFLSGIIAGLVIYIKIKDPETVINENQRIGKIKNTGDGATQNTSLVRELLDLTGKPLPKKPLLDKLLPGRAERKAARLLRRNARREAKLDESQPP